MKKIEIPHFIAVTGGNVDFHWFYHTLRGRKSGGQGWVFWIFGFFV